MMAVLRKLSDADLSGYIRAQSMPVNADGPYDELARATDAFADARVILLGECSHGTSEFYQARAAITQRLVAHHGFRIVAIEGDWPDAAELDRYVRSREPWGERDAFVNFPRWMWRNREFADCLAVLRSWNATQPKHDQVAIRGLDVYSLDKSIAAVLDYLDRVDPEAAATARERYACLSPFVGRPQIYGAEAVRTGQTCETEVVHQLMDLLNERLEYAMKDGDEFFDAEQNARVVCVAEQYYRSMYHGSASSWNLRDSHMFSTLRRLLDQGGPSAKIIVWAHNSHIGNAGATGMSERGEFNIGQLCREHFGKELVAIGFSTSTGTVMAADDWGGLAKVKRVIPARPDSWERVFEDTGLPASLTRWRDNDDLREALDHVRLERAIGVIYRPETERWSHYFEANLARQFDALVWIRQTSAVTPLPGARPEGAPDTYPFGL
ncbi:MAG: carboxylic ester hydrolase [Hyphomonas sp. BRH_c22]|nr:MAG: carboxylic ester hydrolase [Hyphomonas sp. BRH_c22]